ncbi:MAG: hypothetical protein ABID40_04880 [Candidatus Bipolaricaulota bacterium]
MAIKLPNVHERLLLHRESAVGLAFPAPVQTVIDMWTPPVPFTEIRGFASIHDPTPGGTIFLNLTIEYSVDGAAGTFFAHPWYNPLLVGPNLYELFPDPAPLPPNPFVPIPMYARYLRITEDAPLVNPGVRDFDFYHIHIVGYWR